MPVTSRKWFVSCAALLALSLLLRLVAMSNVVLIPEEAYYWMYSRHLSWGYYDHPPMVAWVIRAGTTVFGDTELGVRVTGCLLMCGASVLMFAVARLWYPRRVALISAMALQALPVYFGVGFIATMESSLLFFWLACLLGVSVALRHGESWGWYLAGAAMGAAMLSKYTGVFLGAGAVLAVCLHKPWRRHLRTPHPYLGSLIAVAMFTPVVMWNARHDWASFRFQFVDRYATAAKLSAWDVFTFFAGQLAILTPIPLALLIRTGLRRMRTARLLRQPRTLFAVCFCVPMLLVLAYKALRYPVHLSWAFPAYLAAIPATVNLAFAAVRLGRGRTMLNWAGAIRLTALACVAVNVLAAFYLLVLQPRVDWVEAFGPWRQLAMLVQRHVEELEHLSGREPLVVAGGKYRLASVLAFYREPIEPDVDASRFTTSGWLLGVNGIGYQFWLDDRQWVGRDCVFVADGRSDKARPASKFAHVDFVPDANMASLKRHGYFVTFCRDFRPARSRSR
jgi:dolichol-phosphate mannosyltransferase